MEWYIKKRKQLLKKYLNGTIRPEEKRALEGLLLLSDDQAFTKFLKEVSLGSQGSTEQYEIETPDFAAIIASAEKKRNRTLLRKRTVKYIVAACIIVLLIAGPWWFYKSNYPSKNREVPYMVVGESSSINAQADLPLSAFSCSVIIADRMTLKVRSRDKGILLKYNQLQIEQNSSGVLQIHKTGQMLFEDSLPKYVEITTPALKQYKIELPGGIHVRIDGGSTFRYMLNYKDSLKQICGLKGRAYVEVQTNKKDHLFILENTNTQLQTWGGAFVCLSEKGHTRTIALQGNIGLIMRHSLKTITLNEMANTVDGYSYLLKDDKVKDSTSAIGCLNRATALYWTKQARRYDNVPVGDFMRDMERWYGFTIEHTNCLPKAVQMNITVNYTAKLQEVFAAVEKRGVGVYINKGMLTFCPPPGKLESKRWQHMVENESYFNAYHLSAISFPYNW